MECHLLQGFLLSRPISGADLLAIFRKEHQSICEVKSGSQVGNVAKFT